ncbi:nucleotidyl transferase AbiEii/AbiGii toxin family protein [Pseudokineococcus sp. 1T1Z-3]|uniref:nucleotidyl transferase AbiEii/AbiGii toxin family protein n=1 Tax=Pseudokineococcus sp. 1T1Z-3 TaxID=3132745 RepID=UPI0030B297F2
MARASALSRQLGHSRFLARVFDDTDSPWVLKGGSAVLMRVDDGRTTKDVDLLHEDGDLDAALAALRAAAARDLGDYFRFVLQARKAGQGAAQPDVAGYRLTVEAFCGTVKAATFPVDLVTGSLMTSAPDAVVPVLLDVPGLAPPIVRLYPVVDHVAHKICAVQARYGHAADQDSSRVRDLVDLVVFALSVDVDGAALTTALHEEWSHRRLDGTPHLEPPESWQRSYPPVARGVPRCVGYTDFATAREFVARFLGPPLARRADGLRWSAAEREWTSVSGGRRDTGG